MIQLILHLVGDYLTQSDWMAQNKSKAFWPAYFHALVYSLPFLLISSRSAVAVIFVSHFLIDRFRLARYVVWAKNHLSPGRTTWIEPVTKHDASGAFFAECWVMRTKEWWQPWSECSATGYHKSTPDFLAVWLMIAADNTLHLAINYAALAWL